MSRHSGRTFIRKSCSSLGYPVWFYSSIFLFFYCVFFDKLFTKLSPLLLSLLNEVLQLIVATFTQSVQLSSLH